MVKEFGRPVVGLCMDEDGIPETAAERVVLASKLAEVVNRYEIALENLYLDALIEPTSISSDRGLVCLETIRGIKSAVPTAKTVICLSAISHGSPERTLLNRTYLPLFLY